MSCRGVAVLILGRFEVLRVPDGDWGVWDHSLRAWARRCGVVSMPLDAAKAFAAEMRESARVGGDTRLDLASLPSAADIVRYMRATGWAHGRQGSHGAMWTRGDVEFSVPHEDDRPSWLREVVGRLASAEGRTPEATAAAIAAYRHAGAATKDCGCGPLEPCGTHLGRGSVASVSTSAVTSSAPAPAERSGAATGPAEHHCSAGRSYQGPLDDSAEAAEAKLAVIAAWASRGGAVDSTAILAVVAAETPGELAALGGGEASVPLRTSEQWAVAWGSEDATKARVEHYDDEEDAAERLGLYGDGAYVVSREVRWGPWRRALPAGPGEEPS